MPNDNNLHIDFKSNADKLFNPLFHKIRKAKTRFVIVWGGSSSSKSYSVHQSELINLLTSKNDTLFIRKHGTDIYDSCYKLLKDISESWKLDHLFSWVYSNAKREIANKITGKRIILKGIDDPEKLKSIVGIQRIIIEEANQLTRNDLLELNRRARGIKDIQIILIFNPINETHWIKSHFFDMPEVSQNCTFIHATYKDNLKHLTQIDIDNLELLFTINPNQYRIYVLGEWGRPEVKRPYAYNFDRNKHVSDVAIFDEKKQVYLSFDFNVDPFVAILRHIWQDKTGIHWHVFKEIALKNGDVYEMCEQIKSILPVTSLTNIVITGDATSRKREVTQRNNINAWWIIQKELKVSDARMQVPRSNPNVADQRHPVNAILALHPDYKIHPSCKGLINEFQFTEADMDGDIIKSNRKDLTQRSDYLDNERYAMWAWLSDFMNKLK